MNVPLNITFISNSKYLFGGASAIRHYTYFKGLAELGHRLTVISLHNIEKNNLFIHENISIIPLGMKTSNKLSQFIHLIQALNYCKTIVSKQKNDAKIDLLVILTTDFFSINKLLKLSQHLNIPIIHERTEYPFIVKSNIFFDKLFLILYLKYQIPKFDGLFVINKALFEYFSKYKNSNCIIQEIPTVVDIDLFESNQKRVFPMRYIAYCGSIYGNKDGTPIMIEAFKKFSHKHPDIQLLIAADISNKRKMKSIYNLITGYEDKIKFLGFLDRKSVINLLLNADALVLSRPANKQAEGGFPSKLGEYLATGKPVIITDVGEVTNYLKDGKSAYISKPNSSEFFFEKMDLAFSNYEQSIKIGQNGKQVAKKFFDYRTQSKKLEFFLNNILEYKQLNKQIE